MASLRNFKKEVDYLVSELVSDCYTCLYINGEKNRGNVLEIIEKAVELRNNLFDKANHPDEKHNRKLVKKHFATLRGTMFVKVDEMFNELSALLKA